MVVVRVLVSRSSKCNLIALLKVGVFLDVASDDDDDDDDDGGGGDDDDDVDDVMLVMK